MTSTVHHYRQALVFLLISLLCVAPLYGASAAVETISIDASKVIGTIKRLPISANFRW